jgi:hypothetical protein
MEWQQYLKSDPLPWLLEPESPGTRYLALRDLAGLPPNSAEVRKARRTAHKKGPIAVILSRMEKDGFWERPGSGYNPKYRSTVWAVILLAQLGALVIEDKRIVVACEYLMKHALTSGGQFTTTSAPSGTADCLQGNLCWALLELGCDPADLQKAFEWMARSVTGEGVAPITERHAAVRYYAGKCGPNFACGSNNKLPCAWGGVKVMLALGKLPQKNRTTIIKHAIRQGAEFLLDGNPAKANYPNGYSSRPSGNWWKFGYPVFYVTDLMQNVEALANIGLGKHPRLKEAIAIICSKQDDKGRWPLEYDYLGKTWVDFGPKNAPNKWVTLRALRTLKAVAADPKKKSSVL